jgi:hypothetical protein
MTGVAEINKIAKDQVQYPKPQTEMPDRSYGAIWRRHITGVAPEPTDIEDLLAYLQAIRECANSTELVDEAGNRVVSHAAIMTILAT